MNPFRVGLEFPNNLTGEAGGHCAFWEKVCRTCRRRAFGQDSWGGIRGRQQGGETLMSFHIMSYHLLLQLGAIIEGS